MKTRTSKVNSAKENTPTKPTRSDPPTVAEIRERAHEIFVARGGAPGKALGDWLAAKEQLKRECGTTN